nr:MAG TPA: hypothetical protein [Bacteriophage sp.]
MLGPVLYPILKITLYSLDTILNITIKVRLYHRPKIGRLPLRAA